MSNMPIDPERRAALIERHQEALELAQAAEALKRNPDWIRIYGHINKYIEDRLHESVNDFHENPMVDKELKFTESLKLQGMMFIHYRVDTLIENGKNIMKKIDEGLYEEPEDGEPDIDHWV